MALNVGSRLGHYDVTALIGEGGMVIDLGLGPNPPGRNHPEVDAQAAGHCRADAMLMRPTQNV